MLKSIIIEDENVKLNQMSYFVERVNVTDQLDPKDQKIEELENRLKDLEKRESEEKKDVTESIDRNIKWIMIVIAFILFGMGMSTIMGSCSELMGY